MYCSDPFTSLNLRTRSRAMDLQILWISASVIMKHYIIKMEVTMLTACIDLNTIVGKQNLIILYNYVPMLQKKKIYYSCC